METQEVLDKTAIAISMLEWEHDISIAAALDVAMKRVKDWERLKAEIATYKRGVIASTEVGKGIIMGLSYIFGIIVMTYGLIINTILARVIRWKRLTRLSSRKLMR